MVQLEATQKSFNLVSVPAGADNVSYWTCKVISQRGGLWKDVWGLSLHNPSVICFPGCDFPFHRALIRSADTWEPSAVSSRGGDTLTGRGIRAD